MPDQVDHYSTLGVSRGASPDEIKRAWRKKASAAHPDRGGSDADMQNVNRAYAILASPEARAQYDATGDDRQGISPAEAAERMLSQMFEHALDAPEGRYMDAVHDTLAKATRNVVQAIETGRLELRRLERRRKATLVQEGRQNLVHALIDRRVQAILRDLSQGEETRMVLELAAAMLASYRSQERVRQSTPGNTIADGFATAFMNAGFFR